MRAAVRLTVWLSSLIGCCVAATSVLLLASRQPDGIRPHECVYRLTGLLREITQCVGHFLRYVISRIAGDVFVIAAVEGEPVHVAAVDLRVGIRSDKLPFRGDVNIYRISVTHADGGNFPPLERNSLPVTSPVAEYPLVALG